MTSPDSLRTLLEKAVTRTGDALLNCHVSGEYRFIPDSSPNTSSLHTEYDKIANALLLDTLFPDLLMILGVPELLVVSEEIAEGPSFLNADMQYRPCADISAYDGFVLVMDPICGSIPYVRGVADYIVSIAIVERFTCIASAVYQPDLRQLFFARKGAGAFCDGKRIFPASTSALNMAYLSIEHSVYRDAPPASIQQIARDVMRIRTAGTCALEMCYLASGRIDGLIKLHQSYYDYLPGTLFLEETGLGDAFTGLDGKTRLLPLRTVNEEQSFIATTLSLSPLLSRYTSAWALPY